MSVTASEQFPLFVLGKFGLGRIPTGAGEFSPFSPSGHGQRTSRADRACHAAMASTGPNTRTSPPKVSPPRARRRRRSRTAEGHSRRPTPQRADGLGSRREGLEDAGARHRRRRRRDDARAFCRAVSAARRRRDGRHGRHGKPRPASRLAILPATSHAAVITQVDLLHGFIEPFLNGQTPKGFFEP